jgi:hypothetical protein
MLTNIKKQKVKSIQLECLCPGKISLRNFWRPLQLKAILQGSRLEGRWQLQHWKWEYEREHTDETLPRIVIHSTVCGFQTFTGALWKSCQLSTRYQSNCTRHIKVDSLNKLLPFCSTGVWTQVFTLARQVLCHLSCPFCFSYFSDRTLCFLSRAGFRFSYLCLSYSWEDSFFEMAKRVLLTFVYDFFSFWYYWVWTHGLHTC